MISEGPFYIYIYAFSRGFYPKRLTVHSGYIFIVSMCVSWELNPQPLRYYFRLKTGIMAAENSALIQQEYITF